MSRREDRGQRTEEEGRREGRWEGRKEGRKEEGEREGKGGGRIKILRTPQVGGAVLGGEETVYPSCKDLVGQLTLPSTQV